MREDLAPASAADHGDAMALAQHCLGGRKTWRGTVTGGLGLIRRTFVIESEGTVEDGALVFRETLTFDDEVTQDREWRIAERPDGLSLEADGVRLTQPGRVEDGALVFDYRLVVGGVSVAYHDRFRPDEAGGGCANVGVARFWGLPVMTIVCHALPADG